LGTVTDRLPADRRREALLDIALELFVGGGAERVTMGSVAERAEVTRTLVYKHFANRNDLLAALHRREAARLDRTIRHRVMSSPEGFDSRLRAFIRAAMEAIDTHGVVFVPLQPFSTNETVWAGQKERDRRTILFFGQLAAEEFGLPRSTAEAAMAVLLAGVHTLLSQARKEPSAGHRRYLENLYVDMVLSALAGLSDSNRPPAGE
jgi:AcrR family transcriptional regulator